MANKFMIVLFNLNEDQNEDDFVKWMKDNDIPVVSKLSSVTEYNLAKTVGMLGAEGEPPYKYMEIIRISDFDKLGEEASAEAVKNVGAQFQQKVKDGIWLLSEQIA
jgi:hypothetical protein